MARRRLGITGTLSTVALAICALVLDGCAYFHVPRIDPTGQRIFAEPPISSTPQYRVIPNQALSTGDVEVLLSPQTTVAPLGSEVVLVAGVCGGDGYLRTNRRLEWSLDPAGVGHFVAVAKGAPIDLLLGDCNWPRKIDNTFAIGSTSRSYVQLNRGTPTTGDDVCVQRGEGWITLSSPVEGTSYVDVLAPEVDGWPSHRKTATVHWVDAQWCFPPPAINSAGGSHIFTTTVRRQSDQSPRAGWLVRYEIVDGPPAGFAPDGEAMVEVVTDSSGQATVEVFETEPGAGTNRIAITLIRPASVADPLGEKLAIAHGSTLMTWTAPELALQISGPETAALGTPLTYHIQVSNPGDIPAGDVVVTDELPEALVYVESSPAAEVMGRQLRWQVGQLGPSEDRTIDVKVRATKSGSHSHCVDAVAGEGLHANDCATIAVGVPHVELEVKGPDQATIGRHVTFEIIVSNPSQWTATDLVVEVRPGLGLEVAEAAIEQPGVRAIETLLPDVEPGQQQQVSVSFLVTRPGRLCPSVEITGELGVHATAQPCLDAVGTSGAESPLPPPSLPPISETPNGSETPITPGPLDGPEIPEASAAPEELKLSVVDLRDPVTIGRGVTYEIRVSNPAEAPHSEVALVAVVPEGMVLNPIGTSGPNEPVIEGKTVRFPPLDQLAPGATQTYRIRVDTRDSGEFTFRVELTSREMTQPLDTTETTQVVQ